MIAVRLIPRAELKKKLGFYKCSLVQTYADGVELWQTGWGTPFTLVPEGDDHRYDEWQYRRVLVEVIAGTMPPGWELER